ncbi:hypothetical protein V5H98_01755 [Georgenia sp. M64]|uniref:hypothetical protein n=1 Tax=Georgenia sp. M64 TaxID=3120520 RepID=UPI0030E0D3E3
MDFQTEDAVADVIAGAEDELVDDIVSFGRDHGARAREDHALFVDAFRNGRIPGLEPAG